MCLCLLQVVFLHNRHLQVAVAADDFDAVQTSLPRKEHYTVDAAVPRIALHSGILRRHGGRFPRAADGARVPRRALFGTAT